VECGVQISVSKVPVSIQTGKENEPKKEEGKKINEKKTGQDVIKRDGEQNCTEEGDKDRYVDQQEQLKRIFIEEEKRKMNEEARVREEREKKRSLEEEQKIQESEQKRKQEEAWRNSEEQFRLQKQDEITKKKEESKNDIKTQHKVPKKVRQLPCWMVSQNAPNKAQNKNIPQKISDTGDDDNNLTSKRCEMKRKKESKASEENSHNKRRRLITEDIQEDSDEGNTLTVSRKVKNDTYQDQALARKLQKEESEKEELASQDEDLARKLQDDVRKPEASSSGNIDDEQYARQLQDMFEDEERSKEEERTKQDEKLARKLASKWKEDVEDEEKENKKRKKNNYEKKGNMRRANATKQKSKRYAARKATTKILNNRDIAFDSDSDM